MLEKVYIPLLSAFLGALSGSYLTANKADELWAKQDFVRQYDVILNKRIELIERVSRISNLAPKFGAYQSYLELQGILAQEYIDCTNNKLDDCVNSDSPKEVTEVSLNRADLNAEFASTIQMVSLYFHSEEVKNLTKELGGNKIWWKNGEPQFRDLIKLLHDKLYVFDKKNIKQRT